MASLNPLRAQNRAQDPAGITHKDHQKSKVSASLSAKGSENQNPNVSAGSEKCVKKLNAVSRLPVLAKSLQPAPSVLSQNSNSEKRWEQRPLVGKIHKKRTCTKPIPFNLSQSRTRLRNNDGTDQVTVTALTGTTSGTLRPHGKTNPTGLCGCTPVACKTKASKSPHPAITSLESRKAASASDMHESNKTESLSCSKPSKVSIVLHSQTNASSDQTSSQSHISSKDAGLFVPDPLALQMILQKDDVQSDDSSGLFSRLSICPTGRGTSIYSAQRVPVKKSQKSAQTPTRSALSLITKPPVFPVSQGETPVYSAKRVPLRKAEKDDFVAGSAVSFSPDPAALRSILLNEGVRAGSSCLTGRGTSIYSAQRVPLKKTQTETTPPSRLNATPVLKWIPQRIPNIKPQSMRKIVTAQKMSKYVGSPGLNGAQDAISGYFTAREEDGVVQRLFGEMEDNQKYQEEATSHKPGRHPMVDPLSTTHSKIELKKTSQPFIQATHRESVIVFSSRPKICQSSHSQDRPHAPVSHPIGDGNTSHNALINSDQSNDFLPSVNITKQIQMKAHLAAARRRQQALFEEMLLDEECATYTSRQLLCPLQPRCANPVASTISFQDSICFLPIGTTSPGCPSPVFSLSSNRDGTAHHILHLK